ncbi:MAG: DUF2269 family protein [Actinomycetes bacterium]
MGIASASGRHTVYAVLVGIHVIVAVVGFGSVALGGIYGFGARRPTRPGTADELRRFFASPSRARVLVVLVPVLGVAALEVQPHGRGLGQAWVIAALALAAAEVALVVAVIRLAERGLRQSLHADGGTDRQVLTRHAGRMAWAGVASDVVFVVALALMVLQP